MTGESESTSKLSREHVVGHPVPGLVVVAGGKYTTYRVMAADAIGEAARTMDARGADRGFASTVLRLTIQAHGRLPLTAVAKVGPDAALDREAAFYRELADRMAAPAPRCWYAGPAPDGTPVVLRNEVRTPRTCGARVRGAASNATPPAPPP